MNTYYEKRPEFQAVQFTGPGSIEDIMKLCNLRRRNYKIEGENSRSKLTIVTEDHEQLLQTYVLNQGQWLVVRPDHTRVVVNDDTFRDQFEAARAVIPRVSGLGILNDQLYRNDGRSSGVVPSPGALQPRDIIGHP
jgi:hypothetical protein